MKNKNKQTKFPVARIKKIMQKDEEVGKVAQATPIVISKALELFLALIIEQASKVTTDRGSKKVEAYHLKHAVETTEMLDFLKEIVQAVPDPSAGGTIDLDAENEGGKKRRSRAKRANTGGGAAEGTTKKRRKKKGDVEMEQEQEQAGEGDAEVKSDPDPDQDGDAPMQDDDDDD
ncbi:histone-fold-containing protein [Pluteus cervinus]|uniref:Histone-fold-containing protein n=1 Tax=Pluteus cervinus TaxID=181527 RepID=A0ACD3ALF0_9AGAR|nr:histone-fold-containing protein [Pluteus cervinus]